MVDPRDVSSPMTDLKQSVSYHARRRIGERWPTSSSDREIFPKIASLNRVADMGMVLPRMVTRWRLFGDLVFLFYLGSVVDFSSP